jgi:carboxyl-terminal processing protease
MAGWLLLAPPVVAAEGSKPGAAPANGGREWAARGREVLELVKKKFYDPRRAWQWAREHRDYAAKAESRTEFEVLTRAALAELRVSHTGYYTPDDPEYFGLLSIFGPALGQEKVEVESIGADFTEEGFVRAVFAGSPAGRAGLKRGDRVEKADGRPFRPVESFRRRSGKPVVLSVRSREGDPVRPLTVIPRTVNPREEWLAAQKSGTRIVRRGGRRIGYVPMFSCAGEDPEQALREAVADRLAGAEALILDFRDGWGGCNPSLVGLFNPEIPVLTSIGRDGKTSSFDSQWRRPLYLLINGRTRSGKEVVAYALKKHHRGTLVGERTAGAAVAGSCFLLSDRSLLYLAVADFRVDGERLEGIGVAPDVSAPDRLPYAGGQDPQLEKALTLAGTAPRGKGGGDARAGG